MVREGAGTYVRKPKRPFDDFMSHTDGDCTLTMDNRYYPLLFCDIDGAFTLKSVEFFFVTWRQPITDYAESRRESVVVIIQISKLRPPPATVRKAAGEHAAKDASTAGLLSTHMVVSNPLLRGVMTAIVWIAGSENTKVIYDTTMADSIRNSIAELKNAGIQPPQIDPTTYDIPIPPPT